MKLLFQTYFNTITKINKNVFLINKYTCFYNENDESEIHISIVLHYFNTALLIITLYVRIKNCIFVRY